jgi:hypothetical protein
VGEGVGDDVGVAVGKGVVAVSAPPATSAYGCVSIGTLCARTSIV